MDAHFDTLSVDLCQMNTHVGFIAQHQAEMGGYTMPSTLMAPTDKSDADDADDDSAIASNDEDDGDASLPSDDEMST